MSLSVQEECGGLNRTVRVLHVEDSEPDRELVKLLLQNAGIDCEITAIETADDFERCVKNGDWDVILTDYALPAFDGFKALAIASKACPRTPVIFVTGTLGEESAVESLKSGATDYVVKQRMERLGMAVRRALKERAERLRLEKTEAELKSSEERLRYMAYHDALTGLPNRALFQDRLSKILSDAGRREERVALLFIDLDNFKNINDSLGHPAGDVVLQQVAERLKGCARNDDTVARLGGDEFVVVVSAVNDSTDAGVAADRIRNGLAAEFKVQGKAISTSCSIGIGVFPEDGRDSETLFKNADAALFSAKENGRNHWQFFTPEMNRRAVERLWIESALRDALRKEQFFLEYQPQIELSTGRIIGAEALIRWQHPEEGLIPPNRFISVAESNGEIIPIGAWVLKTACAQAKQWQIEGLPPLTMAVNISAVQVRHGSLPRTIKDILDETGLAPEYLELETTESLLLAHDDKVDAQMRGLRDLGLRMAIDDFGTGYSGFSYVRRFRFDRLKIDGSFVQNLSADPNDTEIVSGIMNFGATLKMEVIAECVETEEQLEILRTLGCDQIQGYYFSRPLGAPQFAEILRSHSVSLPARSHPAPNVLQLSRKRLEMAISLSEALMESLPAVVCIFNASGQVRRWNTNFLGYSEAEMLQAGIMHAIAPERLDSAQRAIKGAFEHGKTETEAWLIAKSGAKIPCYLTGVRIVFEDEPCVLGVAIDLSKQKQSEEELGRSREEYDLLFEGIGDAVFVSRVEKDLTPGKFIRVNRAAGEYLGYTREELYDMSPLDIDDPETAAETFADLAKAPHGEPVLFETRHIAKDGRKIPVEINARTVQLKSGAAGLAIVRDISDRKRAEEALRENEERFRSLINSTPDWVWEVDVHGVYTYVSPRVKDLLGYEAEEVIGRKPFDLMPDEEAKRVAAVFATMAQSCSAIECVENVNLHKDGRRVVLETSATPIFDSNGSLCGYRGIDRDITERKCAAAALERSESDLKEALQAAHMGVWTWTQATNVTTRDENFYRITGLDPKVPIPDDFRETAKYYTPQSWAQMTLKAEDTLTTGTAHEVDLEMVRPDGSTRWIIAQIQPLRDDSGQIIGLRGTDQDITERKRAEESLKLFRALIDQSNDAVEVLDPESMRYLDVNERACADLGYTREELLNMSVFDVAQNASKAARHVRAQLQETGSALIEAVHRRKDGSTFPVEVAIKRVDLGKSYLVSTARDISERKATIQKLRLSEAELALRNRLASIFLTDSDDRMYGEVLKVVSQEMRSECGLFGFIDEDGALVVPSLQGQIWEECKMRDKNLRFPPQTWGGAWGRALIEKTLFLSNQSGRIPDGHVPILRYLVAPVLHQAQAIGVLAVANKSTDYDKADQETLDGITRYIAPVLHARLQRDAQERARKRAEEQILSLARTDSLTGLANRRALDETLPRETARAKRLHESLAVIFADLDHFKAINDRFGHRAGDQVLARVGAIIKSQLRSYALGSRFGGDEFVLLLPGTAKDGAIMVAERIREKVAASTVPDCPSPFTLSLGVATFETDESGEELVAHADGALYQAKQKGGNRVEVA